MNAIFISVTVFTITLFSHILIHRVNLRYGILTAKSVIIYGVGFLFLLFLLLHFRQTDSLIWTGIILYTSPALYMSIWYLSICLKRETPAEMILEAFMEHKTRTPEELERLFTQKGLFRDRLSDLVSAKCIIVKRDTYFLTGRGAWIARAGIWYRRIIHGS